ncbi:MAG: Tetratricopeptide repeat protein [Candidatus Hinthialibacteria bacterium OLB16]|nr:MAG: Tetratricopeptide repeat protein [Candidatus Hinthialibacteria bacterium OLB16]
MRNLASAEKDLKAALSWSPQTAYLHDQLADVYAVQGKKEQALNEVRKAVALHPVKWSYHEHASRLLFQLGRKEQAREERLKAEALKPYEPQYGEALKASLPSADSR